MKKTAIVTAIAFAAFVTITAQGVMAANIGSILNMNLVKYDPFPVEAGTQTTAYFDIVNKGQDKADNVNATLGVSYPFSLPNNDAQRAIPQIIGSDSQRIEYNLLVDQYAKNGTYPVTLKLTQGSSQITQTFNITVRETLSFDRADIVPLFVSATPDPYPGSKTTLTVDITNVDKGTAYYAIVQAASDAFTINRNQIFVGTLNPNDFDSVDIDMSTNNVAPGTYPVNITTIYKDQNSREVAQSSLINVKVISAQAAKQLDSVPTPVWVYAVYVIALVVVVRYVGMPIWRRARKK